MIDKKEDIREGMYYIQIFLFLRLRKNLNKENNMIEQLADYAIILGLLCLLNIVYQLEQAGKILQSMSAFIRKETK